MAASSEVQVNSGDDSGVSACSTSTVLDIAAGEPWFGGWLNLMDLVVVVGYFMGGWMVQGLGGGWISSWLDGQNMDFLYGFQLQGFNGGGGLA